MSTTREEWINEHVAVLEGADAPEELQVAVQELAASDDPDALEKLGAFLRRRDFLDRLDKSDGTVNLRVGLSPLIAQPSPEVARMCLKLVDDPMYLEHDRKSVLLEALASLVPMSTETAAAFRRSNQQGYFAFDALLLACNGSAVALDLFREMMLDKEEEPESRVELVRKGILPHRNRLETVEVAASLAFSNGEPLVVTAAIESIFDYRPEWFKMHGPTPPPWRTASTDVLRYVVDLGDRVKRLPLVSAELRAAIDNTSEILRALLAARAA